MNRFGTRCSRICIPVLLAMTVHASAQAQSGGQGGLRIEGDVSQPFTLSAIDMDSMKRTEIRAKDHDEKEHSFSGVTLTDILLKAGAALGPQLRGKNMTKYLLVKSKDGYQTVFALAELDPGFTDRTILLADKEDGLPLPPDKGPYRIIVPGEKKHAHWNWGVTALIVKNAGE